MVEPDFTHSVRYTGKYDGGNYDNYSLISVSPIYNRAGIIFSWIEINVKRIVSSFLIREAFVKENPVKSGNFPDRGGRGGPNIFRLV